MLVFGSEWYLELRVFESVLQFWCFLVLRYNGKIVNNLFGELKKQALLRSAFEFHIQTNKHLAVAKTALTEKLCIKITAYGNIQKSLVCRMRHRVEASALSAPTC